MLEIWKDVVGFESKYQVSNLGNIRNKKSPSVLLIPKLHKSGYMKLGLYDRSLKRHNLMIHRLVAMAFVENPEELNDVNHKDGNKLNNKVDNLEWVTKSQNAKHYYKLNPDIQKWGKCPNCKIDFSTAYDIFITSFFSNLTDEETAAIFGVNRENVNDIKNGITWHILEYFNISPLGVV